MSLETNEGVVVHIVDDDESLRRALDRLFRSVGLQTDLRIGTRVP
jgi:FixJ family two-component response regulator